MAAEIRVIARELGCTTVRVSGSKPERISIAAYAAAEGLEAWFAPFPPELTTAELIELFCEDRAEYLRREGARVVLVTGCELTLFNPGFLPGANSYDRIARLSKPSPRLYTSFARLPKRLNTFLAETADSVRGRFGGPLTSAPSALTCASSSVTARPWSRPSMAAVPTSAPRTRAALAGTSPTTTTAPPGSGASTSGTSPSPGWRPGLAFEAMAKLKAG